MNFRLLCKTDYIQQLLLAGYSQEETARKLEEENPLFDKAEEILTEAGGCLVFTHQTTAYLYYILVYEEHRNKGCGKLLLEYFEAEMRKRGMKKIQLNVFVKNEVAKKLYKDYCEVSVLMEKSLPIP